MTEEWFLRGQSLFGAITFAVLAWLASEHRTRPTTRFLGSSVIALVGIAILFTHVPVLQGVLRHLTSVARALQEATLAGTSFVFGYVGGAAPPFEVTNPENLFSFAFQALPLIILLSGLANVLFYWGLLGRLVEALGRIIQRWFGVGGAVGLTTGANLLFGPAESALLVRPYLSAISRSQLFAILTVGTSTVSGTVLVLYASIIGEVNPAALGHVIVASFMSMPAGLLVAQLMIPPEPDLANDDLPALDKVLRFDGSGDAFTRGITDGGVLFVNILAAVFSFIALVALIDITLSALPAIGGSELSLARVAGWLCAPLAWLAGASWSEALDCGQLLGTKLMLNELIAYVNLAELEPGTLSDRTNLIMIYSLCGFANVGSVGLLISGFGTLMPQRRVEIIGLAPRAIVSGTLASLLTGAVIGVVI